MKLINKYIAPLGIDIEYKVGKNAGDNIDIINSAKHGDIWFHVDEHSSSHVIASMPTNIAFDKKQTMYIIKQGAILCKQHSKYKSMKKVNILYTDVQNVIPTNILGCVNIQNRNNDISDCPRVYKLAL